MCGTLHTLPIHFPYTSHTLPIHSPYTVHTLSRVRATPISADSGKKRQNRRIDFTTYCPDGNLAVDQTTLLYLFLTSARTFKQVGTVAR
jgi:hypothetical protein